MWAVPASHRRGGNADDASDVRLNDTVLQVEDPDRPHGPTGSDSSVEATVCSTKDCNQSPPLPGGGGRAAIEPLPPHPERQQSSPWKPLETRPPITDGEGIRLYAWNGNPPCRPDGSQFMSAVIVVIGGGGEWRHRTAARAGQGLPGKSQARPQQHHHPASGPRAAAAAAASAGLATLQERALPPPPPLIRGAPRAAPSPHHLAAPVHLQPPPTEFGTAGAAEACPARPVSAAWTHSSSGILSIAAATATDAALDVEAVVVDVYVAGRGPAPTPGLADGCGVLRMAAGAAGAGEGLGAPRPSSQPALAPERLATLGLSPPLIWVPGEVWSQG